MPRAFSKISFTPSVKAAQSLYRSREANLGFELADDDRSEITEREAQFIEARDSFYQATVNQDGWPYVQHRGGPVGFLKVIDAHTIGFADFSGNRQYLSVGNLFANDRISLILMDYKEKRRLKIWGRVQIVHEREAPDVIAKLEMPAYRARIERAFIIRVEAWDWNCPQHITARYTDDDIEQLVAPLQAQLAELQKAHTQAQAQTRSQTAATPIPKDLGQGELSLVVSGVRQLTPRIRAIELRDIHGQDLPVVSAGAHLALPVILANGKAAVRHYSIASNPARRDIYEIAVLHEEQGEGGSAFVHQAYQIGTVIYCDRPKQYFSLRDGSKAALLIAGGIGIAAIKPMAQSLKAQGTAFQLHYAASDRQHMAYGDRLRRDLGEQVQCYFSDQGQRLDLEALLTNTARDTDIYVCGPTRMLEQVQNIATRLGFAKDRVHVEAFGVAPKANDRAFRVTLHRSQKTIEVAADQSVLQALDAANIPAASACGTGQCGTCVVKLLAGAADHRDQILSEAQKEGMFCPCVSRAADSHITLDL